MTVSRTRTIRHQATACLVVVALVLSACGDEPNEPSLDSTAEQSGVVSPFAHIKRQPPGGKWIAQARNQRNFVREFKGTGTIYLVGVSLARLVSVAHEVEPSEVLVDAKDADAHFDVVVRPEDGAPDTARKMLRVLITQQLGLEVSRKNAKRMTMVLSAAPSGVLLEPSASNEGTLDLTEGQLRAVGSSIDQLTALLGKDSKIPIVDATQLGDRYDYLLEWDTTKGAYAFIQALGDIGLQLSPEVRAVESLVVDEAQFLGDAAVQTE